MVNENTPNPTEGCTLRNNPAHRKTMGFLPPLARHVLTSPTAMQTTDVKLKAPPAILPDAGTSCNVIQISFGPPGRLRAETETGAPGRHGQRPGRQLGRTLDRCDAIRGDPDWPGASTMGPGTRAPLWVAAKRCALAMESELGQTK